MKKPDDIGFMVRIMVTLMLVYAILFGWLCQCRGDDTASIQAQANTGYVNLGPGTFHISSTIVLPLNGTIIGAGEDSTFIVLDTPGIDGFLVTARTVHFRDLAIMCPNSNSGSAIDVPGASGRCTFDHLVIHNAWDGITVLAGDFMQFHSCDFLGYRGKAIHIANQILADDGDTSISQCTFNTSGQGYGIYQESSGGMMISDCKFLGGTCGYQLALAAGAKTGDLLISNCSIEAMAIAGIFLYNQNIGSSWNNVTITGCEFEGVFAIVLWSPILGVGSNGIIWGQWINNFSVTGCAFATTNCSIWMQGTPMRSGNVFIAANPIYQQ